MLALAALSLALRSHATVFLMPFSEAGYYSLQTGPSGDDYTGFLAVAAGLLLVGVGVTTLWRTRRTDDGLVRRYLRGLMQSAAALVGAYVVLFPFALTYVFTHSAPLASAKRRPPSSKISVHTVIR